MHTKAKGIVINKNKCSGNKWDAREIIYGNSVGLDGSKC